MTMSIAISEEHRALAQTVASFLADHQSRAAARGLLGAQTDPLPGFWAELGGLGLLGLHVPEELGGSGFGLAETLVVAEQMGRQLAPGPFVPTVIASAVLAAAGPHDLAKRPLPRQHPLCPVIGPGRGQKSEEHTSELQSHLNP